MLRRSLIYQLDQQPIVLQDDAAQHSRRARLYPIGVQAHTRSRMFYFHTAPVVPPTSDAEAEFVIRARRHKPMAHTTATSIWTPISDPANSWAPDTGASDSWAPITDASDVWI